MLVIKCIIGFSIGLLCTLVPGLISTYLNKRKFNKMIEDMDDYMSDIDYHI